METVLPDVCAVWRCLPVELFSVSAVFGTDVYRAHSGIQRYRTFPGQPAFFLADFSLMSGAIVLLDTSGMHYGYAPLTLHSYLWHFTLVLLGIYAGTRERDDGRYAFGGAVAVYLVCCFIAEGINFCFDRFGIVNMFYINPHYYMVQIGFRSLLRFLPNRAVIVVYIIFTILGASLLHLFWYHEKRRMKGRITT